MNELAMGQVFLRALQFLLLNHSTIAPY